MSYRINQWADFFEAILIKFPKWCFSQLRSLWRRWRDKDKPQQQGQGQGHHHTFEQWSEELDKMTPADWEKIRKEGRRDQLDQEMGGGKD